MILVISNKGFHYGFKLLGLDNFIHLESRNDWNNFSLLKKIKFGMRFKTIHYFWGRSSFLEISIFLILQRKVILHFIGSDVLMVLKSKSKQLKTKFYKLLGAKLLVVHKNLQKELDAVGMKTEVLEFVNRKIGDFTESTPSELSVLSYVPTGKEEFYNLKIIEETAKRFPEIKFFVFPNNKEFELENISSIPTAEHDEVIKLLNNHKLFVRIPKHDGLPNTLVEALMCARYVVWSYDHPFVFKAETVDELSKIITQVKNKNELNYEGKKYVLDNYNTQKIKNKFAELW